ncbi:hypothetical protein HLB23_29885 [Nocardia uniformis]|uniref:Uncharacterized protein n=1 Tax=Nocardia uniformis TaxID=53432 RepID=A0A849C884_9NOCA|nr:hypothetical protein [Nocardia uniformis]NNH74016.1 hypothetical protein [Nocardia uniformis]
MRRLRGFFIETAFIMLAALATSVILSFVFEVDGTWLTVVSVSVGMILGKTVSAAVCARPAGAKRSGPPPAV